MKVTIIFDHVGPYHEARARAANRLVELSVVQWMGASTAYAWRRRVFDSALRVSTVFDDGPEKGRRVARFARTVEETDPDVVFVNGWNDYGAAIAVAWCNRERIPAVLMSESQRVDFARVWPIERIKSHLIRFYSAALCGGQTHVQYLRALGMKQSRIFTGYDVVDNSHFAVAAREARRRAPEFRGRLGLPDKYAVVCARFIPKKNIPFILRGFARARECGHAEEWKLVVLGEGALRKKLEAMTQKFGLQESVLFPGFVQYEEIGFYMGLASLLIHASTVEQWGLVVNEAMAAGLPVLVSNRCGSASELVHDGVNGYQFDPWDVDRFEQLLSQMLGSRDELDRMGQESQRIVADWGPERFARGVAEAAAMAIESGLPKVSALDRLVLSALACR